MSDPSKSPPKSPFQSQRSTPLDTSTELSLCEPIRQQNPISSLSRTTLPQNEKPNTPTRGRWISTPSQSQKPSAQTTPTNSLVCIPRDRLSAASTPTQSLACVPKTSSRTLSGSMNTTQRMVTTKGTSQFNPTATSTPRSTQMRPPWQSSPFTSCPLRRTLTPPGSAPRQGTCPPCPPCPQPQYSRPVSTPEESTGCPFPVCKCVPIPRTDATVQGATSKCPDGGRRERILKLEILAVKGGSLYDGKRPDYDPCYDVDPMIGIRPADSVTRTPKTAGLEKDDGRSGSPSRRSPLVEDTDDEDRTITRDDEGTPDSKVADHSAEQEDLDDDIVRTASAAPAPFHLSDVSLPDMPPVKEEKEDEALMDSLHIGEPPSIDLGDAPFGEVSLPSQTSDLAGLSKTSEAQLDNDDWVKEQDGGARVTEQDGGTRVKNEDGRLKEQDKGARVKVERDKVPESTDEKEETSTAERRVSERAIEDVMSADGRGSFSVMLGPSVRNFARLALSPLVALRTLLGPASNGRPARRKQLDRYYDESNFSGRARIRSVRSAFVVTPYGTSASTFAFLLRRRTNRRGTTRNVRSEDSPQSASSSEESE